MLVFILLGPSCSVSVFMKDAPNASLLSRFAEVCTSLSCFWLHVVAVVVVGHFTHIIQLVPPQNTFLWLHLLSAACISRIASTGKKERDIYNGSLSLYTPPCISDSCSDAHTRNKVGRTNSLARSRVITDVESLLKFAVV